LTLAAAVARAADPVPSVGIDDLIRSGEAWARENLDERVIEALEPIDADQFEPFWRSLQERFQGEYIVDLAALRESATNLVLELEANDATRPYSVWLRARLDYFDVADEFRLTIPAPPVEPGQPPLPPPNPSPELERRVWVRQLEARPQPAGAAVGVPRLKPVFAKRGVPEELVWLAEVESGFNRSARSPAGAVGLYQLMPATARQLGLSLKPKDERLDPEKNARAAARYLAYLDGRFRDWRLALAAYNAGEGRVQRLLDRHETKTFDAIATRLPAETQLYVPKVEAVVLRREGKALPDLPRAQGVSPH
jgi:membrane-bound lytic murein transglycosylase D